MDIYRFVNSGDIRKHLNTIHYEFSSVEAAWLIYQCHTVSVEEKMAAWNELIGTMPDCSFRDEKSLHSALKRYMDVLGGLNDDFCSPSSECVYKFSPESRDDRIAFSDVYFTDIDRFTRYYHEAYSEEDNIKRIFCEKIKLDRPGIAFNASFDSQMRLMDISSDPSMSEKDRETYRIWDKKMWFDFPVPFKQGDIVWFPADTPYYVTCKPLVVHSISLYDSENTEKLNDLQQHGDISDMCVRGYMADRNSGDVYQEQLVNYMNLEYYPCELCGKEKVLRTVSDLLLHKPFTVKDWENSNWTGMNAISFAKMYHKIISHE